ncbi:MAG TPA: hypothetical protein VEY91_10305 [Candidatus Limnocylindria bacterium]|nr:hypothetical protein [Candidatus Limnocylindria bacterium]
MRKLFALLMVAFLALTMALAAVGCGQKTTSETTDIPPAEEPMMADTMHADSMVSDTMMQH